MGKREWLVSLRKKGKKALTQQNVADLSGISREYYSDLEVGRRNPSPEVAKAIGKALKFKWTLFFEENCGEKPQKTA